MGITSASWLGDVRDEFCRAKMPDSRLPARVRDCMTALQAKRDHSFPDAMVSPARLKGFYRLANNPRVDPLDLFEAHACSTAERATGVDEVLVLHDTSTMKPRLASKDEVGEINTGAAGFYAHVSLALDGHGCPLGVLALETLHREPDRPRRYLSGSECAKLEGKESDRWLRAVQASELRMGLAVRPIHVMDREADSHALLDSLVRRSSRFVIRGDDRTCLLEGETTTILRAFDKLAAVTVQREIALPQRKSSTTAPKSVRKERAARLAKLVVSGCTVEFIRPKYLHDPVGAHLSINVVRVSEPGPPAREDPIEWLLTTSEPIDSPEQMLRIVDIYRRRWVIEEFFKAIKTGCLFEERGLQEREALLLAFVMFLPLACQLLWLRSCSRAHPDAPAEGLLDAVQMSVLRHFASRKLPQAPTRRELIWSLASLGGHIKNNGEPGWQVLGRALKSLLELERGWRAALESSNQL